MRQQEALDCIYPGTQEDLVGLGTAQEKKRDACDDAEKDGAPYGGCLLEDQFTENR
jgi:hypothetical protein